MVILGNVGFALALIVLLGAVVIWSVALWHRGARQQMMRAADYASAGRFREAHRAVQGAIRLRSKIQRDPDAVSLYRIILSGSVEGHGAEIDRIRSVVANWPRSRWEMWAANPLIRFGVPLIWVAHMGIQAAKLLEKR